MIQLNKKLIFFSLLASTSACCIPSTS